MKKTFLILLMVLLVSGMVFAGCTNGGEEASTPDKARSPGESVSPEDFYKGATMNFYAGTLGSITDVYLRVVARYFEEATGAKVLVTNYPAAGGMEAINELYLSKADGLTMAGWILSSTWMNSLLKDEAALYDIEKFNYLGAYLSAPWAIWVYSEGDYNSLEKLLAGRNLYLAGASPLGYFAFWGSVAGDMLGLDFKTITGIGGPDPSKLSLMQKETHFAHVVTHTPGYYPDLLPLLINGSERDWRFPDVPTIEEVINEYLGRPLTEEEKTKVKFADIIAQFSGAGWMMPLDVPKDRVDYVREVLSDISANEEFIAEMEGILGYWTWLPYTDVEESLHYMLENREKFSEIYDEILKYYD